MSSRGSKSISRFAGLTMASCLVLSSLPATSAPVTGICAPASMKFVASKAGFGVNSTSFKTISESSVSFTQGGAKPSCVVVRFSTVLRSGPGRTLYVRGFLDDVVEAAPGPIVISNDDSGLKAHAFEFVWPAVAQGHHVVRMQAAGGNTSTSDLLEHTTFVLFAP